MKYEASETRGDGLRSGYMTMGYGSRLCYNQWWRISIRSRAERHMLRGEPLAHLWMLGGSWQAVSWHTL